MRICQARHMDGDTVNNAHNCTGEWTGYKQLDSRERAGEKKQVRERGGWKEHIEMDRKNDRKREWEMPHYEDMTSDKEEAKDWWWQRYC